MTYIVVQGHLVQSEDMFNTIEQIGFIEQN